MKGALVATDQSHSQTISRHKGSFFLFPFPIAPKVAMGFGISRPSDSTPVSACVPNSSIKKELKTVLYVALAVGRLGMSQIIQLVKGVQLARELNVS